MMTFKVMIRMKQQQQLLRQRTTVGRCSRSSISISTCCRYGTIHSSSIWKRCYWCTGTGRSDRKRSSCSNNNTRTATPLYISSSSSSSLYYHHEYHFHYKNNYNNMNHIIHSSRMKNLVYNDNNPTNRRNVSYIIYQLLPLPAPVNRQNTAATPTNTDTNNNQSTSSTSTSTSTTPPTTTPTTIPTLLIAPSTSTTTTPTTTTTNMTPVAATSLTTTTTPTTTTTKISYNNNNKNKHSIPHLHRCTQPSYDNNFVNISKIIINNNNNSKSNNGNTTTSTTTTPTTPTTNRNHLTVKSNYNISNNNNHHSTSSNNNNNNNNDHYHDTNYKKILLLQKILHDMNQYVLLLPNNPFIDTFVYPNDYIKCKSYIKSILQYNYNNNDNSDYQQQQDHHDSIMMTEVYCKCINTAIQLYERTVQEYSIHLKNHHHHLYQNNSNHKEYYNDYNNNYYNDSGYHFGASFNSYTNYSTINNNSITNVTDNNNYNTNNHDDQDFDDNFHVWFCNPKLLNNKWKQMALLFIQKNEQQQQQLSNHTTLLSSSSLSNQKNNDILLSPKELIQSIERMSNLLPYHSIYTIETMNIIMYVFIKQQPTNASYIADQLLDYIKNEAKKHQQLQLLGSKNNIKNNNNKSFTLEPTSHTYSMVLQAWIDSKNSHDKNKKIDAILHEYHNTSLQQQQQQQSEQEELHDHNDDATNNTNQSMLYQQLNKISGLVPYMMVMRYYIDQNEKFENIYNLVQQHPIISKQCNHNIPFLTHLLYCYKGINHIDKAEDVLYRIVPLIQSTISSNTINNNTSNDCNDRYKQQQQMQQQQQQQSDILQPSIHSIMMSALTILTYYRDQISLQYHKNSNSINNNNNAAKSTTTSTYTTTTATITTKQQQEYLNRAEKVFQLIQFLNNYEPKLFERMQFKMMDIYATTRQVDLVEHLFEQITKSYDSPTTTTTTKEAHHRGFSVEPYHTLTKAYGNCNQPDRAEEFVRCRMLHPSAIVKPDIVTINILINAYTESMRHDKFLNSQNASESAYNIYRWLDTNEECIKLNLRPNFVTYTIMLKLFNFDAIRISSGNNNNKDKSNNNNQKPSLGEKVELLFHDMENQSKRGDINIKIDVQMYAIAIKTLLLVNDHDRAYNILHGMENQLYIDPQISQPHQYDRYRQSRSIDNNNSKTNLSDLISVRPNVRIYNEFLNYYSNMRSTNGAKFAEQLLNHMRQLSQIVDKSLAPDIFTYNVVFKAWILSGDENTTTHLWDLYKQMTENDHIDMNVYTYSSLTSFLSYSSHPIDIRRTIQLLQHMHDHPQQQQQRGDGTTSSAAAATTSTTVSKKYNNIGEVYIRALRRCMKRNDPETATTIIKLFIDSYINGQFKSNDENKPDRATFNWIIQTYILLKDLQSATEFLHDLVKYIDVALESTESYNQIENIAWIGPELNTIFDFRKAWTKSSLSSKRNNDAFIEIGQYDSTNNSNDY